MAYRDALIGRYSNSMLKHRTWQIAMDGSQKLPQRLLNTIRSRIASGGAITGLTLGVAGWMRYASGVDEKGAAIDVRDPYSEKLVALGKAANGDARTLAESYFAMTEIFGTDLPANDAFRAQVTDHLVHLFSDGAKATVARIAKGL